MNHPGGIDAQRQLGNHAPLIRGGLISRFSAGRDVRFPPPKFFPGCFRNRFALITAGLSLLVLFSSNVNRAATDTFISEPEERSSGSSLGQGDISILETDKSIERELNLGQKHAYRIHLSQGQFFRITVEQQRIDVAIRVTAPDGRMLARMDSPYGFLGTESVSFVADVSADYVVELLSVASASAAGRYSLRVEPPREPSPLDLMRIQAERAFTEARDKHSPASLKAAVDHYKESLKHWVNLGDLYWQSKTLYGLASACFALGEREDAAQFYKQALSIQDSIQDRRGRAYSLKDLGYLLGLQGNLADSIEFSKKALPLWQEDNDAANQAGTLNTLAVAYGLSGEPDQAISCHNQVLKIREELGDQSGKAQSLNNIGTIYDNLGEPQAALDYYNRALSILVGIENRKPEDRRREATTLNNIGYAYALLGEPEMALNYYEQALPIRKEVNDAIGEGATLGNIGNAYLVKGDTQAAMRYYEQALPKQNRWGKAYTLMNIGDASSRMGDSQKALDHYEEALTLFKVVPDRQGEAAILHKMGRVYTTSGKFQDADVHYERALEGWREVRDRRGEATTLQALAANHRARNNLLEALKLNEAAISIIEDLRTGILAPQLRASYFASVRDCYDLEVDTLMQLHRQHPTEGYDRRALETSERSRGRVLLETLGEVRAGLSGKGGSALIERRKQLIDLLNAKASRQLQVLSAKAKVSAAAEREIQSLSGQIETLDAQIRAENPRYSAVVQPKPLNAVGIQKYLDNDTALLEYALGEQRSYLWVVTEKTVSSFELPGRAEIDAAALQVYDSLTRNPNVKRESPTRKLTRVSNAGSDYTKAAATLSKMLLGPVGSLPASKRLVVVSDGKLQYIPFGALVLPAANPRPPPVDARASLRVTENHDRRQKGKDSTNDPGYQPLLTKYEIIQLPSASVMTALRAESQGRTPAPKAVAVLADPVFSNDDPRLRRQEAPQVAGQAPDQKTTRPGLSRALEGFAIGDDQSGIPRLFFSKREADAIAAAAGLDQTKEALGFDASRATATSDELSQFRIVHFSAHGLVNDKHPQLSGIILSLVDKHGRAQDGFLTLNDIYGLNLPAELAVLSACQTAFGKDVRGEGLISLTRGFMYAGAARVVASLWNVDDAATAELMASFYEGMLRNGQRPAEALRIAQLEMWRQKRWQHPYFWAAFTIQGEWK